MLSWRLKLSNWVSGGILNKYQRQVESTKNRLQEAESEVANLRIQSKQSRMELEQLSAQLQINQGFQIELGQAQIELKQSKAQLQQCQAELEQLQNSQSQPQPTPTELVDSHNWLKQIQLPVEVVEVKRLPQRDFETLWGFGISSPTANSQAIAGSILLRGWVLGKKSLATKVKVIYQGQTLIETSVEQPRPAITQYYPDIPAAANSGFEVPFSVVAMDSEVELELQAVMKDESIIALGVISLKRL